MEPRRILVVAEPTPHGEAALAMGTRLSRARNLELRRIAGPGARADIAREARLWRADLVVLGAPVERAPIDAVPVPSPVQVCATSPCAVLVTRAGHERFAPRRAGFRRPVVGVDYSPCSEPASRLALSLTELDAAVDLLHAFAPVAPAEGISPGLERPATAGALEDQRARELRRLFDFADRVETPNVAVECHVEIGGAAHQILEHIGRQENDLSVLGAHGRDTPTQRAFGTVTDRVLRHAPVPTLLYPRHLAAPP